MILEWLGVEVGFVGTVVFYAIVLLASLWAGRFLYELVGDDESAGASFRDSSEWFGALVGAGVGVVALMFVEGVEVVALFVEFVGGHALGFVATVLAGLAALLAEGVLSLSGGQVVGIAIALVGVAMLSSRWVDL